MKLRDLTNIQLDRVYRNLYNRMDRKGGTFGYDFPTLRLTNQPLYNSLQSVSKEINQRVLHA